MIRFQCPSCSKSLVVNDTLAGKTGKCSGCGKPCTVPSATQATPPEAPPIVMPPVASSISLPAVRAEPSKTGDAVLDALPAVRRGLTTAAVAIGQATAVSVRTTGKTIVGFFSATGKVISTASENVRARRIEAEVEREIARRQSPPPPPQDQSPEKGATLRADGVKVALSCIALVGVFCVFFFDTTRKTDRSEFAAPGTITTIAWKEYVTDCGLKAQKANEARSEEVFRKKYKGKIVNWSGKVTSVSEELLGSGFTIGVSMDPTESMLGGSDVMLAVSDDFKTTAVLLDKGNTVQFTGRLTRQGGVFSDHQIEAISLKQVD